MCWPPRIVPERFRRVADTVTSLPRMLPVGTSTLRLVPTVFVAALTALGVGVWPLVAAMARAVGPIDIATTATNADIATREDFLRVPGKREMLSFIGDLTFARMPGVDRAGG